MNEIWRTIRGWEGLYQASSDGRIKSLARFRNNGGGGYYQKEKIITGVTQSNGYVHVSLYKDGKQYVYRLHKIIALTFPEICGEYFEGAEISHLDDCKTNNKATNLRWVTHKENMNWGTRNERCRDKMINGGYTRKVKQSTINGEEVKVFDCLHDVERETGYYMTNISKCCRGLFKTMYGYKWEYVN